MTVRGVVGSDCVDESGVLQRELCEGGVWM